MVELFQKSVKKKKRIKTKTPFKAHKRILDKRKEVKKKYLRKPPQVNDQ